MPSIQNILKKIRKNSELEENFNELYENIIYWQQLAQIGSWTYDIQKGEAFWTEEVYHILGCGPQDLEDNLQSFLSYVHPDDLESVQEVIQKATEGKEYDIEYRIITPDGAVRFVRERAKVLNDENNNPLKTVGIIQDVTIQKIIEKNLKELGDNLNLAQKFAGVGSWKYDVLKDKFYWSEEMYRIYGIEPSEFRNDFKDALKLIHPEDQIKVKDALKRHLSSETLEIEFRIPQKDGTEKYVIGKGEPLFDQDGRVIAILGTLQDITKNKILELELKKSIKTITQAQVLAHVGSWEMDLVHNKIYYSDEAYKILGIKPEQFDKTYEDFLKYVHPDDVKKIENILENPGKKPCKLEFRNIRPDGSIRNIYQLVEFIFDDSDNPIYIYGIIQDITEQKELQKAIREKHKEIKRIQRKYEVLVQESTDVFEIIAPDGTIKYISKASEKVVGYKPEERIGKKVYDYYQGKELVKMTKMIQVVLDNPNKNVKGNVIFITKTGKSIYLEVYMQNLLHEPAIEGIVVNFRDITKKVEARRRMAYMANHDELTGLPNSAFFKKMLRIQCQRAEKSQTKFAVMMLDIDGLKNIKYSLGYDMEHELIMNIVQRFKMQLDEDIFLSRFSEDHFAFIISGSRTYNEYKAIAVKLLELFSQSYKMNNYELDISANIGIAIFPDDGRDENTLSKQAKCALIRGKKEGKNRFKFYSSDLDIQNYKEFIIRSELNQAIENGQLKVYYQPMVKLKTNEILAVEVLVRWEHPNWGIIPPEEFISLAEETGFIINLGNWVLKEACHNYKQWLKKGLPPIKVSINISSIQFFESNFVDNIKNTIDEFELDPHFLIMEITESVLIKNINKVKADIEKLRALGIQVALDDFGTGFSPLAYLYSFKFDYLKIDGLFIKNAILEETSNIITSSIIKTARNLKIKVVAEGIENWEQLSYLKDLNCHTGQGYLYSKPVALEDFEKILAKKRCRPKPSNKKVPIKEKRRFFRIKFRQLLEAVMTILTIRGKNVNVGNTKVLVENIGPGGLCFISNIRFPVERYFILQFSTQLIDENIKVYGYPVWAEEIDDNLYKYGIEFTIDENERMDLTKILNQVQIKMKNNILFAEGDFISISPNAYFKSQSE